ncbi:4Fe-4S binding protein [Metallumcola ferriviriculae]|uniref:4Fe-4S binding protein n=1 Tax=Metallumcola ferriviriculae TaxID=3039180 RepID=A0AAU0UM34_9FIRM|nr:4Fe-4S binding protein [Desulfitibacteraceae bacterium MK1]
MISISEKKCTGCSVCTHVCPHGVIGMEGSIARLLYEDRCIECGACQLNCQQGAIFVTKGTGCLVSIIKEDILKIKEKGCG